MVFPRNHEKAVSEVVSVIILVAVTVILAAIIGAFVFGRVGNLQKGKVVAATISRVNGSYVSVTFDGGQNAGSVVGINWTVNGAVPASIYIGGVLSASGIQDHPGCACHKDHIQKTRIPGSLALPMERMKGTHLHSGPGTAGKGKYLQCLPSLS